MRSFADPPCHHTLTIVGLAHLWDELPKNPPEKAKKAFFSGSGDQKKRLSNPMAPCFQGTRCETPEAFSNRLRFSRYHRKFRSSASLFEYFGAKPSSLSAFSIETKESLEAVS